MMKFYRVWPRDAWDDSKDGVPYRMLGDPGEKVSTKTPEWLG